MRLWIVAAVVMVLNLPFGFWRSTLRKFSARWFLSVHVPVPIVVALRFSTGLGWHLVTFPVLVGAYFLGQLLGDRLHWLKSRATGADTLLVPQTSETEEEIRIKR